MPQQPFFDFLAVFKRASDPFPVLFRLFLLAPTPPGAVEPTFLYNESRVLLTRITADTIVLVQDYQKCYNYHSLTESGHKIEKTIPIPISIS